MVQAEKRRHNTHRANASAVHVASLKARSLPSVSPLKKKNGNETVVVQRKVGLEFESQSQLIEVEGKKNSIFNKGEIGRGKGYTVVGDEAKLEVVSDAVDETESGRDLLLDQVSGIANFVMSLKEGENKISEINGIELSEEAKKTKAEINLPSSAESLLFHPQATAGVRLMAISDLMDAFIKAPLKGEENKPWVDDNKEIVKAGQKPRKYAENLGWDGRHQYPGMQKALQGAFEEIQKQEFVYPKVKSLFQLGLSYAMSVDSVEPSQNHTEAKFWMSFMSRSKLSEVYQVLDKNEKIEFSDKLEMMTKLLSNLNFYDNGGRGKGTDLTFYDERNWHSWLEGFEKGEDKIRDAGSTGYGEIENGSEKYDMKTPSDIGVSDFSEGRKRMDGVVLELRSLGANVTPPSFPAFGLNVFELIRSVHEPYAKDTSGLEEDVEERKTGKKGSKKCIVM